MESQKNHVLETITSPDFIQRGDSGDLIAIRFYKKTPLTSKYLATVYRETAIDGYVITAYLTSRPSDRREIIWKR